MRLERWFYTLPLRLRSLFRRGQVEQELDEELRYHLDRQIEENISKGMTTEEARYTALRALGGVEQKQEQVREGSMGHQLETLWQDLRYGARMLVKQPAFTLVVVLTLGLGIGANTAIFSVVNAVLLRPLAYKDPAQIITRLPEGWKPVAPANFFDWRERSRSFDSMAAAQ